MRRILVTGAASWMGGHVIRSLEGRRGTEVFAVDELAPTAVGFSSSFLRSSLDTDEFAAHLAELEPSAVVHLQSLDRLANHQERGGGLGDARALFTTLTHVPSVKALILGSDTAVYGSGPRNPSLLHEDTSTSARLGPYEQSVREVETSAATLSERGVTVTVLRFVSILGPGVGNPISRHLLWPVVPTILGSDPRLQFIHEDDAVLAVRHALDHPVDGTFNICADGQMYLSRVLRLGRRFNQRLPAGQLTRAMRVLRPLGPPLPGHLTNLLRYGRVVEARRMREILRFEPPRDCRRTVLDAYRPVAQESA